MKEEKNNLKKEDSIAIKGLSYTSMSHEGYNIIAVCKELLNEVTLDCPNKEAIILRRKHLKKYINSLVKLYNDTKEEGEEE